MRADHGHPSHLGGVEGKQLEGHVGDLVDVHRHPDELVGVQHAAQSPAQRGSRHRAHRADHRPLQDEDARDGRARGAHGHEDRDVLVLLHHEQDQGGHDVEGGHHHDEADGDPDGELLEPERGEEALVGHDPVGGDVAVAEVGHDHGGDPSHRVDVVHAHLDQRGGVAAGEEPLGEGQGHPGPLGVELEEAAVHGAD